MERIFFLSPPRLGGERAAMLLNTAARFDLARRLHSGKPVAIGEVSQFISGLYFRGKLAYARRFVAPPKGGRGAYVITPNMGLLHIDELVTLDDLRSFSDVDIHHEDERYRKPLERDVKKLKRVLPKSCDLVLLGSIGTNKYAAVLTAVFGERIKFPIDFVGRGDMSRGGLLLRCAASGSELAYVSIEGAVRHGKRPPRLEPKSWANTPYAWSQKPAA